MENITGPDLTKLVYIMHLGLDKLDADSIFKSECYRRKVKSF